MTSTRGGADPSNLFVTPAWCVDAVLPHLPLTGTIVDAGCGDGAIMTRIAELHDGAYQMLLGADLEQDRVQAATTRLGALDLRSSWNVEVCDFLAPKPTGFDVDLVISNPPFCLAQEFIEAAFAVTAKRRGTVAMLLRANWPIPKCRVPLVKAHPFDMGWLWRRPDFVASLKCAAKPPCGWKLMQRIDAPRPKTCPGCGADKVNVTTTDSTEYGWLIWGPGRSGRHFHLEIPETPLRARSIRSIESNQPPAIPAAEDRQVRP